LEILEYCDPSALLRAEREQYYLDSTKPEYNILTTAGSNLGYKHTLETKAKLSSINLGKILSKETRLKMSLAKKKENHPMFGKIRAERVGKPFQKIEVLDLSTNLRTEYDSISAAAKALNIPQGSISNYFRLEKKIYKKRYIIIKIDKA
jgi:group I intron endonuclease